MEKIEWNEGFSVGVRKLDEQHKVLIDMINKMIEMQNITVDSEVVSEVLNKMTEYANFHFNTEENLLKEHGYPEYEAHKAMHKVFRKKTVAFCMDTMVHKKSIPEEIVSYLKDWLTHHILTEDMRYKPFFKEKGVW